MADLSPRALARALACSGLILLISLPAQPAAAEPADATVGPSDSAQTDAIPPPPATPPTDPRPSTDDARPPTDTEPVSRTPPTKRPPATREPDRFSGRPDRDRDGSERRDAEVGVASFAVGTLFDLAARRRAQGARTYVEGEAIVEVASSLPPAEVDALESRHRLRGIDLLVSDLTSSTWILVETPGRSTDAAVRELQADPEVLSAEPNQLFVLQDAPRPSSPPATEYAQAKLQLPEAHRLATGEGVLVAVIDSAVDAGHPELRGAIAKTYDIVGGPAAPHGHGTAIAALIVGHARLLGAAPAAHILSARAFEAQNDGGARGDGFRVMKAVQWAAANGARVINMSFAGPFDPGIHSYLDGAYRRGVVLIAAAGNGGHRSAPLYPGADPDVIAVTATDNADNIWAGANRGAYIGLAAPGVDVLVAAPNGAYDLSTGTSVSAAEVSGVAALLLQRRPNLTPAEIRSLLLSTATPLAPSAPRLADAYRAVAAVAPSPTGR